MNLEEVTFKQKGLNLVKRLPANRAGRDFVVGDLHGCRAQLDRLLQAVRFNPAVDRLLSVGDLVDRGADSMQCLRLLKERWFHAIMGNHEQLMLNYFGPWIADGTLPDPYSETGLAFMVNGGNWSIYETHSDRTPKAALRELLMMATALPQVIVVGEGKERFNLVHAELYKSGGSQDKPLFWTDAELDALPERAEPGKDYPTFRWSRKIMGANRRPGELPVMAEGLSETYCGHTVAPGVRRAYSHICIDTGAFLSDSTDPLAGNYGLTLVDVKARECLTLHAGYLEEREL
jgi:serine/threonine protein phosphatase 1